MPAPTPGRASPAVQGPRPRRASARAIGGGSGEGTSAGYAFYPDPLDAGASTGSTAAGDDPFGLHIERDTSTVQRKEAADAPRASTATRPTGIGAAARGVLDAAEMAALALATSGMPDADLVRLDDAIMGLGDALHEHAGDRAAADERAIESALRAASQIADNLSRRSGPANQRERALRQRIAIVQRMAATAEEPRGAADVAPAELLTQLDLSLQQLMLASDLASTAGDREALDHAIEKTMAWHATLSAPAASPADARRLATAVHQQQALLFDAGNELQDVLASSPAGTTGPVVSAYLQAMARSTERKDRAERALEHARIERRRQPLANAAALLDADETTALQLGELDAAAGRKARKEQAQTAGRQHALEARLVAGRRVGDHEIREVEIQAREQAFVHRTQLLELQARQLAAALAASDDGFGGLPNKLDIDVGRLASDLLSLAEEFPLYRDGYKRRVAAAEDEWGGTLEGKWHILDARAAALDDAEARMRKWLAAGELQATLQAAMRTAEKAQTRTFALQLFITVALTVAGNVAASMARGAAEGAWVARASRLGAGEAEMLAVAADARLVGHAVGLAADMAVNATGQKLQGDDASILTLLTINAVNAVVIGKLNQRFDQIESIHVTLSAWSRIPLRELLTLPLEMIAGGALDYGTRMLVQGQATHNVTEQEASAWFWQGAAMALGRHINTRVKLLEKKLESLEAASRNAALNLLGRSDATADDASGIAVSGDAAAAHALARDYAALLADAGPLLDPGTPRVVLAGDDVEIYEYAPRIVSEPGTLDVILHGGVDDFYVLRDGQRVPVDHRRLATYIRKSGHDFERVRLISCRTGLHPRGAAQHLANQLGVEVTAPTNMVTIQFDGSLVIGRTPDSPEGHWETFKPAKSELRYSLAKEPEPPTLRERLELRRGARTKAEPETGESEMSDRPDSADGAKRLGGDEPLAAVLAESSVAELAKMGDAGSAEAETRLRLLVTELVEKGTRPEIEHDTYFITAADGARMAELVKVVRPGIQVQTYAKGLVIGGGAEAWYFVFDDRAGQLGGRRAVTVATADGGLGLPASNVATAELWAFRGAREVKKPDDTHPRDKTQWSRDERIEIEELKAESPLLGTGHVATSLDGGKTAHGWNPAADGVPIPELMKRLADHEAFPGRMVNDTFAFELARAAAELGWNTVVHRVVEILEQPQHRAMVDDVKQLETGPPEAHGMAYSFPRPSPVDGQHFAASKGYAAELIRNCAAFLEKLGLKIPEPSGNMRRFMPAVEEWSTADGPIDARPKGRTP